MIMRTAIFHGGDLDGQAREIAFDDSGRRIRDEAMSQLYARDDNCKCGRDYEIHFRAANRPPIPKIVEGQPETYCCESLANDSLGEDYYRECMNFCPFCGTRLSAAAKGDDK